MTHYCPSFQRIPTILNPHQHLDIVGEVHCGLAVGREASRSCTYVNHSHPEPSFVALIPSPQNVLFFLICMNPLVSKAWKLVVGLDVFSSPHN